MLITQVDIGTSFGSPFGKGLGLGNLASLILSNALVVAGVIFLFLLVFGGISMIASAGSSDPNTVAKGRNALTAAVIGFIIIFASYWIVQIIEAMTGLNILNPGF